MSIDSPKSRPSSSLGSHPLVTSRSAPLLQAASSGSTGPGRIERPPSESPSPTASPEPAPRRVRQVYPGVAGAGGPGPARQEEKRAAPPEAKAGGSPRPLVRFVGEFNLASQVPLESETDAFTALAESIQRSVQQQPDSGHPSSTEGTPQARPSSPVG